MSKWVEVAEGTMGVLRNGSFFMMGETEVTKVHQIVDDEVHVLGGAVAFKIADVRFIEGV